MAWAILKTTGMENRLKERLTGAAILVALIVMLVPEMFRGQGGGEVTNTTASSTGGDGPPVRSYTIDLSNNPKSSGPLQSTTESQSAATPPQPAPVPAVAPAPATPAPAPAPLSAPAAKPTPLPASVPQPQTSTSAPNAARVARRGTTAAAPASAPSKAASTGPWSVQLGIFSRRENAERLMSDAKGKGFNVTVSSADAKGLFHVHSAGLPDRTAAQMLVQRLKADGFQAAVVAP
jgi:cell division septation protein DedD